MKFYFILQFKMLSRKLKDFGLNPWLAYLLILILFIGLSIYLFYKTEYAPYIYLLIGLSFVMRLSKQTRNEFLKNTFSKANYSRIKIIENLLIAIPFCIYLSIESYYLIAGFLFIASIGLGLVHFKKVYSYSLPTPFSRHPFEFPVGFRKSYPLYIIAYFLTVMAIIVGNFNLGLFALVLVPLVCLSFYSTPENEFFVWIYSSTPQQFLQSKIKVALLYTTLLSLPIVVALGFYYLQNIHLVLLILGLGLLYVIVVLLAKYVAFPNEINLPQSILIALAIFFPPLLLALLPFYYIKSKNNLKVYLR